MTDLTPSPEMQLAAKAALRRHSQGAFNASPYQVSRAKRISRGVPLEEHHVHAMDREFVASRDGIPLADNPDVSAQLDGEHGMRGGGAGEDWTRGKVAELAGEQAQVLASEEKQLAGRRTGMEARGMSLSEAQELRRRRYEQPTEEFDAVELSETEQVDVEAYEK